MPEQARALTHVGLVVPDIHAALDWYSSVLGFRPLGGPILLEASSHAGRIAAAIYGPRFGSCKQAQLAAGNGVALELFPTSAEGATTRGEADGPNNPGRIPTQLPAAFLVPRWRPAAAQLALRQKRLQSARSCFGHP